MQNLVAVSHIVTALVEGPRNFGDAGEMQSKHENVQKQNESCLPSTSQGDQIIRPPVKKNITRISMDHGSLTMVKDQHANQHYSDFRHTSFSLLIVNFP